MSVFVNNFHDLKPPGENVSNVKTINFPNNELNIICVDKTIDRT